MGIPAVEQLLAEVEHLSDAGADVVLVHRFGDADRHGLHVATGQSAVGVQAFEDHHLVARFLEHVPFVGGQEAADVHQRVLLGAHGGAVGERAEFQHDLRRGAMALPFLQQLDHVGVLGHTRHVVDDADAVLRW